MPIAVKDSLYTLMARSSAETSKSKVILSPALYLMVFQAPTLFTLPAVLRSIRTECFADYTRGCTKPRRSFFYSYVRGSKVVFHVKQAWSGNQPRKRRPD